MEQQEQSERKNQDTAGENQATSPGEGTLSSAEAQPKSHLAHFVVEVFIWIVLVIAGVVAVKAFVFGTYEIPSGSMSDTIEIGDRVISEKVSYLSRSPEAGEIITFQDPNLPARTLIKRVIAISGQTVDLVDGQVVVDGEVIDEPYTDGKPSYPLTVTSVPISYPITVPEGYVWVMGDNRTESSDSRYFGPVSVDSVTGHAVFTYWPLSRVGNLE